MDVSLTLCTIVNCPLWPLTRSYFPRPTCVLTGYLRVCTYCCKVVLSYAQNPEATGNLWDLSEDIRQHLLVSPDDPTRPATSGDLGWWDLQSSLLQRRQSTADDKGYCQRLVVWYLGVVYWLSGSCWGLVMCLAWRPNPKTVVVWRAHNQCKNCRPAISALEELSQRHAKTIQHCHDDSGKTPQLIHEGLIPYDDYWREECHKASSSSCSS